MGLNQAIDISTGQRKTILGLLRRYLPNTTAWVYGSRVKWTSRPQSDLDMVVFAAPERDRQVSDLREAFEESNLPFRVDLFVWDTVPEQFHEQIEADHVVLVEREERELSREWREGLWGDLATLEYGKALRGYRVGTGQFRVFGTNGPIGWHNEALCSHSSVVIGRKGAYRGVHYSEKPFFVIDTAFYLKPKSEIDTRWAYYELLTQDINGLDSGSAIPSTSRDEFYSLPVMIPPLPEQRAIAHILGTLDDKIELNRRMNQTLEEMARALFKSWFVDFHPVRAKIEGRWRRSESLPGLPADLYDLFPDRLIDSELGKIPEGWEVKTLGEMVKLNPFESLKRGTVAPFLPMASLPTSGPNPDDWVPRKFTSGTRFRNGDTLLARITPSLENGKTAFVQSLPQQTVGWGSTEFIVMRAIHPVPPEYTYLLARDSAFREHSIQSMTGTSGRQRVQTTAFSYYHLPCPPEKVWAELSRLISPVFAEIELNRRESRTLASHRDSLLPKLVSGKIRIKNMATSAEG